MQTVSFETAKALKEAGFPCPAPVVYGQMYYTPMGGLLSADVNTYLTRGIFAPTATDLIPPGWYLYRENEDSGMEIWACASDSEVEHFHHDNPAEAAALAWLYVNKK